MKITYENFRTPGQFISALLDERDWSGRLLAGVLDIDETGVNRLIQDKRTVTAELAIALEDVFGVPANDFLELQKNFDLAKARITTLPNPKRATRAKVFGDLPISEMIKRGWLDVENSKDIPKIESELSRFFKVEAFEDINILPHAAKKTNHNQEATQIQLAWLHRVKTIAEELIVAPYSQASVEASVSKLNSLLRSAEEIRKVPRILAEHGIRFVIVESLKSAKIDGVCFWLNNKSPVIGMSLRYDRIDNFWFVLRHELEHVIQKHGQISPVIDAELEGVSAGVNNEVSEEERIANEAAAAFCVPPAKMESFFARKSPFFHEVDILGFANTLNIHPGLVAGQIQRRTNKYNLYRNHLVKVRSIIAPSAVVDGWGDVYPVDE